MPWAIAVALWWLLPAGVAPVGLVGVPFACEVGRCACGSGGCWALCRQTAGCNAGTAGSLERLEKKPLLRPWGALEPLLWPCDGVCLQCGRGKGARKTGSTAWQRFKKDRIHTSGGPRRRPGQGRRISGDFVEKRWGAAFFASLRVFHRSWTTLESCASCNGRWRPVQFNGFAQGEVLLVGWFITTLGSCN